MVLTTQDTNIYTNGSIHIKNPLNPKIDAAVINCSFKASVNLFVSGAFNVTGSIPILEVTVNNFTTFFKSDTTLE